MGRRVHLLPLNFPTGYSPHGLLAPVSDLTTQKGSPVSTTSPLIQDMEQDNETGVEMQQEATDNLYNIEMEEIDGGASPTSPGVTPGGTPGS